MFRVGKKYFLNAEDYADRSYEVNPKDLLSPEIRELLSNLPKDESSNFTIKGKEHFKIKEYREAIEDFTKAIDLNSKNINAIYYRGLSYSSIEQYHEAIDDFSKVIEFKPAVYQAFLFRGQSKLLLQTYDHIKSAILDFATVIKQNSTLGIAYFLRGYCYLLLKQEDLAKLDWIKAKEDGIATHDDENWKKDFIVSNSN